MTKFLQKFRLLFTVTKTFPSQFARREEKLRSRVRAARVPDVGAGGVLGGPPRDRGQPDGGQAQEGQRGRAAAGAGLGIMMMTIMMMIVFN